MEYFQYSENELNNLFKKNKNIKKILNKTDSSGNSLLMNIINKQYSLNIIKRIFCNSSEKMLNKENKGKNFLNLLFELYNLDKYKEKNDLLLQLILKHQIIKKLLNKNILCKIYDKLDIDYLNQNLKVKQYEQSIINFIILSHNSWCDGQIICLKIQKLIKDKKNINLIYAFIKLILDKQCKCYDIKDKILNQMDIDLFEILINNFDQNVIGNFIVNNSNESSFIKVHDIFNFIKEKNFSLGNLSIQEFENSKLYLLAYYKLINKDNFLDICNSLSLNKKEVFFHKYRSCTINIDAKDIWNGTKYHLNKEAKKNLIWYIQYVNQQGKDHGGIRKDYAYNLGKYMKKFFFVKKDNYHYFKNNNCSKKISNEDWYYVGKIMAKMMFIDRQAIGIKLHPYIIIKLKGKKKIETKLKIEYMENLKKLKLLTPTEWNDYQVSNEINTCNVDDYINQMYNEKYEYNYENIYENFIRGFKEVSGEIILYMDKDSIIQTIYGYAEKLNEYLKIDNISFCEVNKSKKENIKIFINTMKKMLKNEEGVIINLIQFWTGSPYINLSKEGLEIEITEIFKPYFTANTCGNILYIPNIEGTTQNKEQIYRDMIYNTLRNQKMAIKYNLNTQKS